MLAVPPCQETLASLKLKVPPELVHDLWVVVVDAITRSVLVSPQDTPLPWKVTMPELANEPPRVRSPVDVFVHLPFEVTETAVAPSTRTSKVPWISSP